jgi:hypothetical protein
VLSAYRVVLVLLIVSCLGWGQSSNPSDQETIPQLIEQVKELQQHDRDLEERIKVLETARLTSPAVDSQPPAPSLSATEPPDVAAQPPGSPEIHILHGIQWRGFAEVNYKVLDQRVPETGAYGFEPGSAGNFYTGDFGLFLGSRLTDKASVLSEIVFEEGEAQSYSVDLRRMLLKYDVDDHLKFSFGRYQTSIGYYNWAFRSAAWLQTTADRPLVMEYASNGGLLPTQAVGVSVTGEIPSGKLGLNYIFEYGSSGTIRPDINSSGEVTEENNGNHINLALFLRPSVLVGLQLGGSFYHDKISDSNTVPRLRYGQTIINGYAVYISHGYEFLNEGFLIRHALLANALVYNTPAFYTQFSKRLGPIRPFFRYQYVNASGNNDVFDDVGLRFGPSFGARYDLNDYFAFKAQLDRTARRGLPDLSGLHLQLAVTF